MAGVTRRSFGRINAQEHGGWWRAWLDGKEVSSYCYEANDQAGYVTLLHKNEYGELPNDFVPETRFGDVRIERIERTWQS